MLKNKLILNHWIVIFCFSMVLSSCEALFLKPKPIAKEDRWSKYDPSSISVEKEVEVRWNEYMIPYIFAQNERDLARVLGYTHMFLRYGQFSVLRMVSQGRVSEMAGVFGKKIDRALRTLQIDKAVPQIIERMPKESLDWSKAYLEGLNQFIIQQKKEKPIEMRVLNIPIEIWSLEELVTCWKMVSLDINWGKFADFLSLQKIKGWEVYWSDLLKLEEMSFSGRLSQNSMEGFALFGFNKTGSNSVVVSKSKSKTDASLIANDPHLGTVLPNVWLLQGLHSPTMKSVGMMLPALPFIVVGRNPNIAWGGTNMLGLSSYLKDAESLEIVSETEEKISVRNWFNSKVKIRTTSFGPIVSDTSLFKSQRKLSFFGRATDTATS